MNPTLLNHALASAFTWTWKTSLSATVLVALVLFIRLAFGKVLAPRWRYALGLLVLLRFLLPAAPPSSLSIFNLAGQRSAPPPPQTATPPTILPRSVPVAVPAPPMVAAAALSALTAPPALRATAPVHPATVPHTSTLSPRVILSCLWLAGFVAMLAVAVRQQRNFVRKLGRWEPVREPRVLELLEQCRALLGVRRGVLVLAATGLNTPALFGVLRPRLLLPPELLRRLDDRGLRHIFLHELMHLKRGDLLVNWAMILVRAAHWFNPAVWLACKNLRADQELACDAAILARLAADERRHYGRTLVNLLDDFSAPALCPGVVPFITRKQTIKRRITMISNFKPAGRFAALASLALLAALGAFTFTRAAERTTAARDMSNVIETVKSYDMSFTRTNSSDSGMTFLVTIGKDGSFHLGTGAPPVDIAQLRKILEGEAASYPNLTLLVRVNDDAAVSEIENVINAAKKYGIKRLKFLDDRGVSTLVQAGKDSSAPASSAGEWSAAAAQPDAQSSAVPDSVRADYAMYCSALAQASAQYKDALLKYPPGSQLLGAHKAQLDQFTAKKLTLEQQYPQLTSNNRTIDDATARSSNIPGTDVADNELASMRNEIELLGHFYDQKSTKYQADSLRYPPDSPLLKASKQELDILRSAKDAMERSYQQLLNEGPTVDNVETDPAASPAQRLKTLADTIRVTQGKLRDLRDRQTTYTNENPYDPKFVITLLQNSLAQKESERLEKESLLNSLQPLSREQLRQALPTTVPDAVLTDLIQTENAAEQKLVVQKTTLGENNPDVVTTRHLVELLNSQIDKRVQGILGSLQTQIDVADASSASLKKQINERLKLQSDESDLVSQISQMQTKLDRLQARLAQMSASLNDSLSK